MEYISSDINVRGIKLLIEDLALRKAAKVEGVDVMGTIGVLDSMLCNNLKEI